MAAQDTGVGPEEEAVQKTVWSYAGKVTLWLSLILSGLALERLGLTSAILSNIVPGEVQTLQANLAETNGKFLMIRKERDDIKVHIAYIDDAQERLDQCLSEVKRIEASLQAPPTAEAHPSQ